MKADTLPVTAELQQLGATQCLIRVSPPPRPGQSLKFQLPPHAVGDSSDTTVRILLSAKTLDSLRLGGLRFSVPSAWKEWTFVLQTLSPVGERVLQVRSDSVELNPLATGHYRLAAFQDHNGDHIWNAGSIHPWAPQEPYRVLIDSIEVGAGPVTDVTGRFPEAAR